MCCSVCSGLFSLIAVERRSAFLSSAPVLVCVLDGQLFNTSRTTCFWSPGFFSPMDFLVLLCSGSMVFLHAVPSSHRCLQVIGHNYRSAAIGKVRAVSIPTNMVLAVDLVL